jgi:AcrR family transcriptional regulator
VRKGETTRQAILDHAFELARRVGLHGLTIGRLANDLDLSKSGLFAHFNSKEALQIQVLDAAAERFIDVVVRPALAAPRGEPRLRALFDRSLKWEGGQESSGGCIFMQAAFELDDQDGPARDRLVQLQRDWLDTIATIVSGAVTEGQFKPDTDPGQFAYDFQSVVLGYHHAARLLRDRRAEKRARAAFDTLVAAARPKSSTRSSGARRPVAVTGVQSPTAKSSRRN